MKIQSLAIMFIILILPISLVLTSYTQSRIETLSLQSTYDSKLKDATYDALKAYQLNSLNSDTSDLANSRMRNIKASVNTFFNTMATSFSTIGYTKETIQSYVPALVYTMYDGYYIYSPYKNIWYTETAKEEEKSDIPEQTSQTYSYNQKLYGLKPYIYYSCRYKGENNKGKYDVVITYSLDNYIQIQGTVAGGKVISKYGYLLEDVTVNGDQVIYKNQEINEENGLKENVCVDGEIKELKYIKKNGTKYYNDGGKAISVLNGKALKQNDSILTEIENNNNAKKYYKEAYDLMQFIKEYLEGLNTTNIVNEDKNSYYKIDNNTEIFDFNDIESETSNFNTHRIDVIKNSIERNLSIAISNFNEYSGVKTEFQMPKLKDSDWDKIMDNISIISFLQGMNIGGKVYNGYSIITNNKNEDIVMEDSIYIKTSSNDFCRVTEKGLSNPQIGIYNINLERRTAEDSNGNTIYYFPVNGTLSYGSIVTQNKIEDKSISEYLNDKPELAEIYYTALGRERYGLYRPKIEISNIQ